MSVDTIEIVKQMSPEELEMALKHLPEPIYARIVLYGDFDYSAISRQTGDVLQKEEELYPADLIFGLKKVSKEKILEIYRKQYEQKQTGKPDWQKRICLREVGWRLDGGVRIELTPDEVTIKYKGHEPNYITEMRRELEDTDVRIIIEANM